MSVENQTQQLRLNVTNIHSFLLSKNKEQQKFRRDKINLQKRKISFEKKQQEEKILESVKTSSIVNIAQNVAESPKIGILDKIFNFGGLLLTGILVNAVDKIVEEGKKFYNNNKKLFDTIGNFLSSVKDAVVGLLDSFTGPESEKGAFDHIGKFNADGTLIRFEKEEEKSLLQKIEEAYDSLGTNLNKIEKAVGGKGTIGNFLKDPPPASEKTPPASAKTPPPATATPPAAPVTSSGSAADSPDLKTAIRRAESGNDYGATFRAYLDGFSRRNENITNMSINQVVQYQKDYIAHQRRLGIPETQRSAAVGAYQMLYPELAASKTGVPLTAKFNKKNQDRMADYYLNVAGYQQFIQGKITAEQFNNRLAAQFASLKTTGGGGVYDTDGINRAYENLLDLIKKSKPQLQSKITPVPNKGNQAAAVNTPDPRDRRNRRGRIIALQRVNTLVPYTITVPVSSSSSGSSTPINNPLAWA
jgi:muramidase (phage lysozyme)